MNAEFYHIREQRNVLLAHRISPGLAARRLAGRESVVLASSGDLRDLAGQRRKLLHVTGLPPGPSPTDTPLSLQSVGT